MSYALRSDNSETRRFVGSFSGVSDRESTAVVTKLQDDTVSGLIWPPESTAPPSSTRKLLARIEELEQKLAKESHLRAVRQASAASAKSLRNAWGDD